MARRETAILTADGALISAIGGLFTVFASGRAFLILFSHQVFADVLVELILIGPPGLLLLGGGFWLSRSEIPVDLHQRVAGWTIAGLLAAVFITMVGLVLDVGISNPLRIGEVFSAFGAMAGFGIGVNNAKAQLRTRELETTIEELETTKEQLEASNERLEQFAYAVSHDLQEPLRMVSSYLQLLERRYADDLDGDAQEFIDYAVDGAERMQAMIESLLAYSRVITQGQPLEPTDTDAVLADVLEDLQLRIEETDATVTADELPTVQADPDQLAQVFRNLISNALQYSGDEPPRVHVGVTRTDDAWRFSVTDEGIGIDPEYHDQIFTVFEQLQTNDGNSGTGGIGLALCERIVERHGGEIWVDSQPGEGATFSFTLPAAGEHDSSSAAGSRASGVSFRSSNPLSKAE